MFGPTPIPRVPVRGPSSRFCGAIEVLFGDEVSLTYVMGGLHREAPGALAATRAWLEAGAASGMPVDARLWLEGPPRSSYPACIAVVAPSSRGRRSARADPPGVPLSLDAALRR